MHLDIYNENSGTIGIWRSTPSLVSVRAREAADQYMCNLQVSLHNIAPYNLVRCNGAEAQTLYTEAPLDIDTIYTNTSVAELCLLCMYHPLTTLQCIGEN